MPKGTAGLATMLALYCGAPVLLGQSHRPKEPVFVIRRPTVVAFFAVTARDRNDPDTNGALSDFQFYAAKVRGPLSRQGIAFKEVYVRSFRVIHGGRTIRFRARGKVGYYFAAPATTPKVEYGVETDLDLIQMAARYFRLTMK